MKQTIYRSEYRYSVVDGQKIDVQIAYTLDTVGSRVITGEVRDLSTSGTKLVTPGPVRTHDHVSLRMLADDVAMDEYCIGEVRWSRLGRDYQWYSGIVFDQQFSPKLLESLASEDYLERRQAERIDVSIPSQARRELTFDDIPIEMLDVSSTGFRLKSTVEMVPGERVLVDLMDDERGQITFQAHVRWVDGSDRNYLAGCRFVSADTYSKLSAFLPEETCEVERSSSRRWVWSVAGFVFITCGLYWYRDLVF